MKQSMLFLLAICSLWLLNGCGSSSGMTQDVATHFAVTSAIAMPTAGVAFNVTVTALNASGQMVTTYSGTVHFASTDAQAVLPASLMIANGTGTFSATLKTAGPQTITATDANSLTGTSTPITVTAIPSPVPLVYQPLSPAAVAPGWGRVHSHREWHRLRIRRASKLERQRARNQFRKQVATDG
jgi:hypothetical protein